jgi:heterodisulfide reductase subunit A2
VLRPSDGKEPDSIAYVQCAGSRDRTLGVEYCSRVCCMYAIKQAMLLSGALPLADITIYYMDIRTFGKGYEQFYQNATGDGHRVRQRQGGQITEDEDKNPVVRVEMIEEGSRLSSAHMILVVLSVGMLPGYDLEPLYQASQPMMASRPSPIRTSSHRHRPARDLRHRAAADQWISSTAS